MVFDMGNLYVLTPNGGIVPSRYPNETPSQLTDKLTDPVCPDPRYEEILRTFTFRGTDTFQWPYRITDLPRWRTRGYSSVRSGKLRDFKYFHLSERRTHPNISSKKPTPTPLDDELKSSVWPYLGSEEVLPSFTRRGTYTSSVSTRDSDPPFDRRIPEFDPTWRVEGRVPLIESKPPVDTPTDHRHWSVVSTVLVSPWQF